MLLLSSVDFFLKINFFKNSFRSTIGVSNSLDPDKDQLSFGPDLDPNFFQRLSADDKVTPCMKILAPILTYLAGLEV